jgi:hypothetical protein
MGHLIGSEDGSSPVRVGVRIVAELLHQIAVDDLLVIEQATRMQHLPPASWLSGCINRGPSRNPWARNSTCTVSACAQQHMHPKP